MKNGKRKLHYTNQLLSPFKGQTDITLYIKRQISHKVPRWYFLHDIASVVVTSCLWKQTCPFTKKCNVPKNVGPSRDESKLCGSPPCSPNVAGILSTICKTVIAIVAACTRTACMFPWSAIFLHLLQIYFSIFCRNISPSLTKIFLPLLQKYFSTSCLDFPYDTLLHPISPPQLGAFGDDMDAKEFATLFGLFFGFHRNPKHLTILVSNISLFEPLLLIRQCCPQLCSSTPLDKASLDTQLFPP